MSNTYEMMFILRPDLTGEQVNKQLHKYSDFLKANGADKVSIEVWGKRRLAYPIQRFLDGIYVLTYYTGDGSQVAKIEREMRFSEQVIRYLTLKQEPEFEFEEKSIPELQTSAPQPQIEEGPVIEPPVVEASTEEAPSEDPAPSEETQEVAVEA